MSESAAEVSVAIRAPEKKVWAALTDPDLIRQYFMGSNVSTDWKVGSPITFRGEYNGKTYEDKGKILAFKPNKELKFSHWSPTSGTEDARKNYNVVDITLGKANGSTEVTLTQSKLEGDITDDDRAHRDDYTKNWTSVLNGLKKVVES